MTSHKKDSGNTPGVSVIVCTRDRVDDLADCLKALSLLEYPAYEVVVVDNAPTSDATQRLVSARDSAVRYVCEPRAGLNWARNRAIHEAKGEIIAFADDDVIVESDWLSQIVPNFEGPKVGAVTGLVVPHKLETEPEKYFERYGGFGCGYERKRYPHDRSRLGTNGFDPILMAQCGTGASMAFRRSVFNSIGLFDPALDVGTATNGGGDIEMFYRVMKHGFAIIYEPKAVVRHRHRQSYSGIRRQIEGWGSGYFAAIARSAAHYPDERRRLLWLRARALVDLVRRYAESFIRDQGFPRDLILAELAGMLSGSSRYKQARREAERLSEMATGAAQ